MSSKTDEKNSITVEFLNSPDGYFVAGSPVIGKVIITLSKPIKARRLTLTAYGSAKTSFSDKNLDTDKVHKIAAEKIFLKYQTILWSAPNQDVKELPVGTKSFNFSFELPINCLPSFKAENGKIKYSVKAEMDMHLGLNMKEEKKLYVLTIMHPSIVNNSVDRIYSHKVEKEKFIVFKITLDKEHYVCGEDILLSIDINNETSVLIDSIETGLTTKIILTGRSTKHPHYITSTGENFSTLSLAEKVTIKGGQQHIYQRKIKITKFFPTITDEIFDVKHFIYVKFHKKSLIFSTVSELFPITLYTAKLDETSGDTVLHNVTEAQTILKMEHASVSQGISRISNSENNTSNVNEQVFHQVPVSREDSFEMDNVTKL